MSIHRIVIFAVMTGYLLVNVNMQINFFAGQDIFSKYQIASTAAAAVRIAQEAYYAKTAFLLTLLVLLAFNVPFGLAFGLSFMLYAMTMLIFFGVGRSTCLYAIASITLLGSYFLDVRINNGKRA